MTRNGNLPIVLVAIALASCGSTTVASPKSTTTTAPAKTLSIAQTCTGVAKILPITSTNAAPSQSMAQNIALVASLTNSQAPVNGTLTKLLAGLRSEQQELQQVNYQVNQMNPAQVAQVEKTAAATRNAETAIDAWVKSNCKG